MFCALELTVYRLEHVKNCTFSQLVIALSGTLSRKRAEFVKLIHENGAQVSASVTQKVHIASVCVAVLNIFAGDAFGEYSARCCTTDNSCERGKEERNSNRL